MQRVHALSLLHMRTLDFLFLETGGSGDEVAARARLRPAIKVSMSTPGERGVSPWRASRASGWTGSASVFFGVEGPAGRSTVFLGVEGPAGRSTGARDDVAAEFLRVGGLRAVDELARGGFSDASTIGATRFSGTERLRTTGEPARGGLPEGDNDIATSLLR